MKHKGRTVYGMIEIPHYMKLVVNNQLRRTEGASRSERARQRSSIALSPEDSQPAMPAGDSVQVTSRVSGQNRAALESDVPTALEAEKALMALKNDLPASGQSVEDLHSGLDRRVIISLLAPLVY